MLMFYTTEELAIKVYMQNNFFVFLFALLKSCSTFYPWDIEK